MTMIRYVYFIKYKKKNSSSELTTTIGLQPSSSFSLLLDQVSQPLKANLT